MRSSSSPSQRACFSFHPSLACAIGIALLTFSQPFFHPGTALAQQVPYATITKFTGTVNVRSQVSLPVGEWRQITEPNHPLFKGDEIKTDTGTAEITYADDGSLINLEEEAEILLHEGPKYRKILGIPTGQYISRTIKVVRLMGWRR